MKPAPAFDCTRCGRRIAKRGIHHLIGATESVSTPRLRITSTSRLRITSTSATFPGTTSTTTTAAAAPGRASPRTSGCGRDRAAVHRPAVRKARWAKCCGLCGAPILIGSREALIEPPDGSGPCLWCHLDCTLAAIKTSAGSPPAAAPKE